MNQIPWPTDAPDETQFTRHHVIDELHQGMTVFTFEHPSDWPAHSQLVWNMQDSSFPAQGYAATVNPRGSEAFEFLPVEACFWLEPNFMYTPGQKTRGQTCLPPMSAPDALAQFLIPKYRGDRQNLHILYVQPVADLARMVNNVGLLNQRHEGVMARIEYAENGRWFEEEFYACVMWHPPGHQGINWGLDNPFCFRAARGQLDAARATFWRIATSAWANPQWGELFRQLTSQLNGQVVAFYEGFRVEQAAQIDWGNKMREYREWQTNLNQQQVNARWASHESRSQQVGDMLGGAQRFHDPSSAHGNPHFNYGHHRYSWTNGRGEWVHSHEASYDPNTDPNTSSRGYWYPAQPM